MLCGGAALKVRGALHELKSDARQVERLGGIGKVDEGVHLEGARLGIWQEEDEATCGEVSPRRKPSLSLWTQAFFLMNILESGLFFASWNDSNKHRGP